MRKIIASILAAALTIGAVAMEVSANTANTSRVCPQNGTGKGYHCVNGNFVDENNDGICDNYANGVCSQKVKGKGCRCGNGNFVDENNAVLEAVLSLPAKYRDVVYLHYYENYTAPQISKILRKNVNTVYTLMTRSKELLREKLGGDGYER